MTIKIYGLPASRTFRCLWAAEESGLPYENLPWSCLLYTSYQEGLEGSHRSPYARAMLAALHADVYKRQLHGRCASRAASSTLRCHEAG